MAMEMRGRSTIHPNSSLHIIPTKVQRSDSVIPFKHHPSIQKPICDYGCAFRMSFWQLGRPPLYLAPELLASIAIFYISYFSVNITDSAAIQPFGHGAVSAPHDTPSTEIVAQNIII